MKINQRQAVLFNARCDFCGAQGPESETPQQAGMVATQRGWVHLVSVDATACMHCAHRLRSELTPPKPPVALDSSLGVAFGDDVEPDSVEGT